MVVGFGFNVCLIRYDLDALFRVSWELFCGGLWHMFARFLGLVVAS